MVALRPEPLTRLAVFPLPDVVLFPGSLLPLHVFEPRYREMAADVISGDGRLGIVRLAPGYESDYQGRPALYDIACVGEIVDSKRLPDGRYTMIVRGTDRIRLLRELAPERAYREVDAEILDGSGAAEPSRLEALHSDLIVLCDQLSTFIDSGGPELRSLVRRTGTEAELADLLAGALVADPDDRQTLLEMLDAGNRLETLVEHVTTLLVELSPRTSMPN